MRTFSIVMFSLFYILNLYAQAPSNSIRCIYQESYIKDSAKPKDICQDEFALDIYPDGKSAFYSIYERAIRTSRDSMLHIGMTATEVINQRQICHEHTYILNTIRMFPQKELTDVMTKS